jgi:hypothetical protein
MECPHCQIKYKLKTDYNRHILTETHKKIENIYKNIHKEMVHRLNVQFIKRTHFPRHKYLFRVVQQQLLMKQLLPREIYNKKYKNLL